MMRLDDDDIRLPGYRRERLADASEQEGVHIPDTLTAQSKAI
ncbi:MAG TPA: hypothetical protein VGP09_02615 [Caballeronia sp.]|jgi:(2R)-3-sulfolactate dehydrogenase (NADP+)|nr:hypothetical protein [Caballeronia sp.]